MNLDHLLSRNIRAMTSTIGSSPKRTRGRPTAFDRNDALRKAMHLFWDQGYEGTTFDELTKVMGISPSTFYNSFGNKEQLYREATDLYLARSSLWFERILREPTDTKTAIARLFEATAMQFTNPDLPTGCMISLAVTHTSPDMAAIRSMMAEHRAVSEAAILARLQRGVETGDLPANANIQSLAAFCSALLRGMAVLARDGATASNLLSIGQVAMAAWPVSHTK